ncbi:TrmB family transcriptional regulator [Sulfolobales archaeon HS-7]|nr:TrmB family transcriptional regulator [Sulfolobales archaeon HS-7]
METLDFGKAKVRLPSGKEVGVIDALSFCYGLSDTDVELLKILINKGTASEDEISQLMKISKASVNRSLNKLLSVGFVDKSRGETPKLGRPKYMYKAMPVDELVERIRNEFHDCARIFSEMLNKIVREDK